MKSLLLLFLLLIIGCNKEVKDRNTVTISVHSEFSTLDPADCYDAVCYIPVSQVYETLFELEYLKRPYTLRPLLAESFPIVSRNRLTYTFKIKKGIKYHTSKHLPSGRVLKAQDFVDQIKRIAFQATPSQGWWLFDGKIKGLNEWRKAVGTDLVKFFNLHVEGLRAPDDHTLVIELLHPYPQLLYALALNFTSPIPAEAIKSANNDFSKTFFGTGPYYIVSANSDEEILLKKFPHYSSSVYPSQGDRFAHENGMLKDAGAKIPFVENVRIIVVKEAHEDWKKFLNKQVDLLNLTKDHYPLALTSNGKLRTEIQKENIQLQTSPTMTYWWISFNMKDPLLGKNLNLRKAIAHGVDIERFIEVFTYNIAQRANSIYPPGIPGYSPSVDLPYKYDLKKAKDFLAQAGFPGGKGLPTFKFDIRGSDSRRREMGEFVKEELKQLGINVEVTFNSFSEFVEKSQKGVLQFWQGGWVLDYPDAENVLQLLNSANLPPGPNDSQYENPEFDRLFNRLKELEDGTEKYNLMAKMEEIVNHDLPWVMQYYARDYVLVHDYLLNFRQSDIIYNNIKYLKLKRP